MRTLMWMLHWPSGRVLNKRHGNTSQNMSWAEVCLEDFPSCLLLFNLLLTLPPTNVSCETTFSHMKLIKTSRRTRLNNTTLNDLLMVKLQSPDVRVFDPEPSIDMWLGFALKPRKLNYKRSTKMSDDSVVSICEEESEEDPLTNLDFYSMCSQEEVDDLNKIYQKDSASEFNSFDGFSNEEAVFEKLMIFSRE